MVSHTCGSVVLMVYLSHASRMVARDSGVFTMYWRSSSRGISFVLPLGMCACSVASIREQRSSMSLMLRDVAAGDREISS